MNHRLTNATHELLGSFADLGTLLPLMLGLIICNGISPSTTLILLGFTYILVGAYYRLPVPVQPMKALAMIAITTGASTGQIRAAAWWMAIILLIFGTTRLADKLSDVFPKFLIHVLQLNLGIMMIRTGMKFLLSYPAILADVIPGAHKIAGHAADVGLLPSLFDFTSALVLLVLPQLPLTIGNAMLATRDCALNYFGDKGKHVTPSRLALSMGIGNFAAALIGGMPICHGAGGMTAHYRLGARTGVACMIIGLFLLIIGIFEGNSAAAMLSMIPAAILVILLGYVGIRHAMLAQESFRTPVMAVVMISSAIAGWFTNNILLSFGVGLAVNFLLANVMHLRNDHAEVTDGQDK
ncbi:MAG: putative sulfate/molybdate transporter [Armatimonadota bacterium]